MIINADFASLLEDDPPDKNPYIDVSELLETKSEYKIEILGYWHNKPIIYQNQQYIVVIASKKQLLLINTNYEDDDFKHSHIHLKTNKRGEIVLSDVKFIIDKCLLGFRYPRMNWMFEAVIRLTDNENYREYLIRKKRKNKGKTKYINTHKR